MDTGNELDVSARSLSESNESGQRNEERSRSISSGSSARALGELISLLSQSPDHRFLFISDLDWLIGPAMTHGQLRIIHEKDKPVAFVLWATVSDAVDKDLENGRTRLKPSEWRSGDNIWIIEFVLSRGLDDQKAKQIVAELAGSVFKGRKFRMRLLDKKTGKTKFVQIGKPEESALN